MFFLGGAGALYFFIVGKIYFPLILVSILLTLLYSLPLWPFSFSKKIQQLGFVKTILLAFTWAFVTVMLPLSNIKMVNNETITLFVIRFLFMLMLCIIFDKRDVAVDKIRGLQTLATRMDAKKIQQLYILLLVAYLFTSFYFFKEDDFTAFIQPIIVAFILWFAYRKSLVARGYLFYYFFIDGLMLVSLLATVITQIKLV
jgi:4-hydroxybenzoate polyprenyltransferase